MPQISSQHHSFDLLLASKYGVDEAILIHHFQHWIRINKAHGRNFHKDRTWTYQTRKEIATNFPYWNVEHIRYLCNKLVELGVLQTDNFNKSSLDRTLWYAFVNESEFGFEEDPQIMFTKREKSQMEWEKSHLIPDTKTTYPKNSSSSPPPPPSKTGEEDEELKNKFREYLKTPEQIQRAVDFYKKQKDWVTSKAKTNPIGLVAAIVRKDQDLNDEIFKETIKNPKELAQKVVKKYGDLYNIEMTQEAIIFIHSGAAPPKIFEFNSPDFRKDVLKRLEDMRLSADGL